MSGLILNSTASQIVETVKDVCGYDVNFIDTDGIIFASTDPLRIGQFHEIGKRVAETGKMIEVAADTIYAGTRAGVNIPIVYHEKNAAVIGISGAPDEVRKFAYLARRITLLLLREQDIDVQRNYRRNQLNYIIRSLIDPAASKNQGIRRYFLENNIRTDIRYQLILIRQDNSRALTDPADLERELLQAIRTIDPVLYTFNYPDEYLLFVEEENAGSCISQLDSLLAAHAASIRIAISGSHSIWEQYRAYDEAKIAAGSSTGKNISRFDQLGLEILCASTSRRVSALFVEKFLGQLTKKEHLLLETYYQSEMSLTRTSEKLYLHKNTVQYQLDQIWKKSGHNPRRFTDAAGFYAALLLSRK